MKVKLPASVIKGLKIGLQLERKGLGGRGLVDETIQMARTGVRTGKWDEWKIVKASNWFARHVADRRRMKNPQLWDKAPRYSPAYVAWALWGDDGKGAGRRWIDKKAKELKAKGVKASPRKNPSREYSSMPLLKGSDGQPLRLYKGTSYTGVLTPDARSANDMLSGEYGIYLTPRRGYAQTWARSTGGRLREFTARARNPLFVEGKYEISPRDLTRQDINRLLRQGYDAIVVTDSNIDRASEVILFDSDQITESPRYNPPVSPKTPYLFDLDPHKLVFTESRRSKKLSRVREVDTSLPIVVTKIRGKYHILDGHHRTIRAEQENRLVRAVVIPPSSYRSFKKAGIHQADMFRAFARELIEQRKASPRQNPPRTQPYKYGVPAKYLKGLPDKVARARAQEIIMRREAGVKTSKPLPGDKIAQSKGMKGSKWTRMYKQKYGANAGKNRAAIARETGISPSIINEVYKRGVGASRTSGHRPGATDSSWALARTHAFVMKVLHGKGSINQDPDLARKVKAARRNPGRRKRKMSVQFYDIKKRKKVSISDNEISKRPIRTKNGTRYQLVGNTNDGRQVFRFVSKDDYQSADYPVIR